MTHWRSTLWIPGCSLLAVFPYPFYMPEYIAWLNFGRFSSNIDLLKRDGVLRTKIAGPEQWTKTNDESGFLSTVGNVKGNGHYASPTPAVPPQWHQMALCPPERVVVISHWGNNLSNGGSFAGNGWCIDEFGTISRFQTWRIFLQTFIGT